ncbi:uridine kinase [Streptomyces sp. BI20]|uniref:uridine kinase n=1 Tax=Streptomyces sp. BI20 TaxID=3403460 RepID=UPI003C724623
MRMEPITWERLAEGLADRAETVDPPPDTGDRLRIAVDGAPAADPGRLADLLAEALRVRGRPAFVVPAGGFLRPASLRFEHGRRDTEAYLDGWYDTTALWRELFAPLDPGGDGRILPDLWDPVTDRATRSAYLTVPPRGVVILHGPFLLGHWFPFDLSVHVRLSPPALARRTGPEESWTLPAFAAYAERVDPETHADVTVRADDPRRPAVRVPED